MNECVCFHSAGPLVTHTVRQYMNLNNAEQLCKLVTFIMIYLGIVHPQIKFLLLIIHPHVIPNL